METGSGDVLQVISHRVSSIEKTAKCRVELQAVFCIQETAQNTVRRAPECFILSSCSEVGAGTARLSSVLRARDISREDRTGDCDEHIEKLNIVHTHNSPLLYEIAERTTRSPLPAYTASFYHIAGYIARRYSITEKEREHAARVPFVMIWLNQRSTRPEPEPFIREVTSATVTRL